MSQLWKWRRATAAGYGRRSEGREEKVEEKMRSTRDEEQKGSVTAISSELVKQVDAKQYKRDAEKQGGRQ